MPKSEQNIYRIARCLARVSKEQAVVERAPKGNGSDFLARLAELRKEVTA